MHITGSAIFAALAIMTAALGCTPDPPKSPFPFSVVFITVDTLRSDRLGAYGYELGSTPRIDQFAAEGALFENVYCDVPWTTASMASMMTSLFSAEHGVQVPWVKLPENQLTVAEIFQNYGYETGAVVGIFSLDSVYGLDQGFDFYDDDFSLPAMIHPDIPSGGRIDLKVTDDLQEYARLAGAKLYNDAYKKDADLTDDALAWLKKNAGNPFFLWVHYFGPHERLIFGGEEYNRDRIVAVYDSEVTETDTEIGRLLGGIDELGLRENTLVVLSSDHGQTLGERGEVGHGGDVFEPEVRIPLIVRLPSRIDAGMRISQVVRSVDFAPTFLDYAGIAAPDGFAGLSVRDLIENVETTERPALMDLHVVMPGVIEGEDGQRFMGGVHYQGLRLGNWKLVKASMAPPCYGGDGELIWDIVGLDVTGIKDATQLTEDQCAEIGYTRLFDVSQTSSALAMEDEDVASLHPDLVASMAAVLDTLVSRKGEAESFDLTPEQERKLKSLGYLE
ncbi:MAG: sulfatase [Myxococcota bacterium]